MVNRLLLALGLGRAALPSCITCAPADAGPCAITVGWTVAAMELPRTPRTTAAIPGAHCRLWKPTLPAEMFATRAFTTAALLASLAFAAAAQNADGDREMARLLARPRQLLLPEELRGNCAGLTITIRTHIDRLRTLQKQAKQEQEGPASTLFGDRPAAHDFAAEQERVQALNIVLDAKGCRPVNVDEELQNPAPSPTPPAAQQRKEPAAAARSLLGR